MKLSRRNFALTLAGAPYILRGQPAALRARVKIDTERVIGDIDPMLYGNFIEHLGRCIDGGIFEEKSPLSDANGFRKDVLEAVRKLNVTLLRWPGGNFSSNYNWRDGIGPRDQRPPRLEMAWGTVESNRFGTHEFLNYVEMLGTQPYICANLGTGTWTEAQQWVEYCNSSEDTAMTRLRRQNGRRDPWKVKMWGLGNEMDGPWQMGHRSAEDYGKFALEAAKLMKWTDPSVKLIAAGSSNFGPGSDWTAWNRTVLEYLRMHADYLSLHTYVGNRNNDFGDFMASSVELDQRTKTAEGIIDAALSGQPGNRKIYIAWDEWNVWYRARGNAAARPPHSGRALQPRGRARHRDLPQLLRQPRPHRQNRQHGATGQRHRAHLQQRQRHLPADHLSSPGALRQPRQRQSPPAFRGQSQVQDPPFRRRAVPRRLRRLSTTASSSSTPSTATPISPSTPISNSRTSSSPAPSPSPKSPAPISNRRTISIRPR